MKKIALVSFLAIMISCSEDKEESNNKGLVCKFPTKFDKTINGKDFFQICTEGPEPIIAKDEASINEAKKLCEEELGGKFYYDGCPSGSVLKCNSDGHTIYYYDNELKGLKCEDLN